MKTQYQLIVLAALSLPISQPSATLAHGGHNHEFNHESSATTKPTGIEVDKETQQRLGIITQPLSKQLLDVGIKATGQIEVQPGKQTEITAPTAGTVTEILVRPGSIVEQGQPVAVISSPELLELRTESLDRATEATVALKEAEANLALAQQNYQNEQQIADREIEAAKTQLNIAEETYHKDKELVREGALPRREMLNSQNELLEAQTNLRRAIASREVLEAETAVKRAGAEVEAATTRVELAATKYKSRLQQLNTIPNDRGLVTVLAPIKGTVALLNITLGESIEDRGTKLITVVDSQEVLATANIPEQNLSKVKIGQQVRVKVSGLPNKTFVSEIAQIDPIVAGDTRVVAVRAKLNNANAQLKPGMFAQLEILTDRTSKSVLAVPTNAIIDANGKQLVYVQNGVNAYQPVEVNLKQTFGDLVEIEGNLFEGDRVVTEGANMLYAQSLRSGNTAKNSEEQKKEVTPETSSANSFFSPSSLITLISFVPITITAFFLGRNTSRKTQYITEIVKSKTNNKNITQPNKNITKLPKQPEKL